jgi:hypothetical protein
MFLPNASPRKARLEDRMKLAKWSAILGGGLLLSRRASRLKPRNVARYGLAGLMAGSVSLALVYIAMGLVKESARESGDADEQREAAE